MNKNTIHTVVLAAAAFAAAAAFPVATSGDTVAWWHFDEADPGATAAANTIASGMSQEIYATPVSLSDATATASGDWMPSYARPFQGLCVYDPVSGERRVNRSAMKFRTAESGKYGGALHVLTESSSIYGGTANAITVEAFVCTTGGVFSTFAPIVACMQYENWTSEKWAIYEEANGTIALRFDGTAYYSGNSSQAGTAKINDGVWHHVAFTWDGSTIKIFVDYVQDKFANGNARQFTKTTTLKYNNGGQWDYTRIGGYKGKSGETTSRRRFNGLIDEVRISSVALTPDQFLRLQPVDMDADEVLRVSFEPGEYGALSDGANIADALGPDCQKALFRSRNNGGAASFSTTEKPSATIGSSLFAEAVANSASISFSTNGTGADSGCYVVAPDLAGRLVGGSVTNYTVECFFKSRRQIRGATSGRQSVFRLGAWQTLGEATLCADDGLGNGMETGKMLVSYRNAAGSVLYDSTVDADLDDGDWHHMAFVVDGDRRQSRAYIDGRVSLLRTNYDFGFAYSKNNFGLYVGCGFDGGSAWRPIKFFDGWIDSLRVTKRALAPEEFMSKNPFGAIGDGSRPLLLADFNGNYDFACVSNASFSVAGYGEARTGGNAPVFVNSAFGSLLLDGQNGVVKAKSVKDASMNRSRVVFPSSPLYELDAFTVEFWAKFTGIVNASGPVANNADLGTNNNAGILRCTQGDTSTFDWYLYRGYWSGKDLSVAVKTGITGGSTSYLDFTLSRNVVDGKWHHYALTFEPSADTTKTLISLYDDYTLIETKEVATAFEARAGRVLKFFEGGTDNPNIVGLVNSLRLSRGVLNPSQFLGRDRSGIPFVLVVR